MPTTAYVEFTAAVRGIQNRTDAAGAAVTDLTGEEDRLINSILSEGAMTADAFIVQADSGMTVTVGSGDAKADLYAIAGEIAGQGTYIARLDAATVSITASAADPAQARTDAVYLIVHDDPYDTSGRALPRLAYRRGDAGGSAPGPDAAWKASALLATIAVGAAATSITAGNITDQRSVAAITLAADAGSFVGARAYHSTTQSIANDAIAVPVALNSEEYDTDGFHSTSVNTSRFTVPSGLGGYYRLTGGLLWATQNGDKTLHFKKNGSTDLKGFDYGNDTDAVTNHLAITVLLAAGDYVEMMASQNAGAGAQNLIQLHTWMSVERVGT